MKLNVSSPTSNLKNTASDTIQLLLHAWYVAVYKEKNLIFIVSDLTSRPFLGNKQLIGEAFKMFHGNTKGSNS